MTVHLRIDRLIIDGLPLGPGDAARVQAAVETALAQAIAEGGLTSRLAAGGALAALPVATIRLSAPAAADELGNGVASALHRGLGA